METTHQSGGLVGLCKNLSGSANRSAKAGIGFFAKPELWAVRLALFAGIIAVSAKSGIRDGISAESLFALSIGLAGLMLEASSAKNVMRSFWEGRPFGATVWATLWVCAFAYSGFQWISVAAEGEAEKSNIHKAAALKTTDVRDDLQRAAAKVQNLRQKSENLRVAAWESIPTVGGVQITDVAQADALIAKAKGNTRFWNLTNGCTETKGPQTRAFCGEYRDALAARASAEKRAVIAEEYKSAEAEVKEAEAKLEQARGVASNTRVESNSERSDLLLLANIMSIEGDNKEQQVEQYASLFKVLAVSIFLSLGAAMLELENLRAKGPRRRLNLFARFYRFVYGLVFGKEPPGYKTEVHVHTDRSTAVAFKAAIDSVKNQPAVA